MPASPAIAFLTGHAVAERLGISYDTLKRLLPQMQAEGFPERDRLFRRYLAADVEAWLATRSQLPHDEATETKPKVNFNAL